MVQGFPPVVVPVPRHHGWRADRDRPLALFVDRARPVAGRDAGSDAALSHIAALGRLGYAVAVADHAAVAAALDEHAGRVRLAYLHRVSSMAWLPAVRDANPGVRVVYGVGDLHGLRARRRWQVTGHPMPPGLEAAELAAARSAETVTHSDFEAALLAAAGVASTVAPWHVPLGSAVALGGSEALFVGSFGHAPNGDAVRWLLASVMPAVWARAPGIRLRLVGRDMPRWVRQAGSERVVVDPDLADLTPAMRHARLALAPLRFGAGVKGKVLTAMAHGVPCLCTPVAAEGLAAAPILRAECDAAGYADAIVAAWHAVERLQHVASASRAWVADHWSARATDTALAALAPAAVIRAASG